MKGLNVRPETIKIQEENISSIPFDRSLSSFFFGGGEYVSSGKENKSQKLNGISPHSKLLHSEGTYPKNEGVAY